MDRMEIVRELLRECHRNQLSSVIPPPYPEALTKLKQMRPEKELLQLYEQRDPVVLCTIEYDPKKIRYEGGSEWGMLARELNLNIFSYLIADLHNKDVRIQAFACEALGDLGNKAAVPILKRLLNDNRTVPGWSNADGSKCTIGQFANHAIEHLSHRH